MSLSEAAAFLIGLGQQVWQQQRDGEPAVCLAGLAPFLAAAAVAGLLALLRPAKPDTS